MSLRPAVIATLLAAGAAVLAGCTAPVLTVRHALPAAVPLPEGTRMVRVGRLTVTPAAHKEAAAVLTEAFQKRLSRHWAIDGDADVRAHAVELSGEVTIETGDQRGTRRVRRWDEQAGAWRGEAVPTLVRTAAAHATFRVARPGAGEPVLTLEADRSYTSTDDPRVRGELGLGRPDDPERVPPTDRIVRELLVGCAEEVVGMIGPQAVEARVQTRGTLNADAGKGLKAAETGDLDAAVRHLAAAVENSPGEVTLRFNLAAALEAAGRLEEALAQYTAVLERTDGKDRDAAAAARRVERVLKRRRAR